MMLSSYLSPSRHGIFYFRWPIGTENDGKRSSIRISLRTRCPDRAGDLARHLASCGRLIRDNKALARLRKDQMREMVRNFFKASLDRYVEKLNDTGVSERAMASLRQELGVHEDAIGGGGEVSDLYLEAGILDSFRAYSDLCEADWAENEPGLRQELRKARRDQIKAFLSAAERLEHYSYELHQALLLPLQRPLRRLLRAYLWRLRISSQNIHDNGRRRQSGRTEHT